MISRRHSHSTARPPFTPLRVVSAPQHHTLPRDTHSSRTHDLHRSLLRTSPRSRAGSHSSQHRIEITHDQLDPRQHTTLPVNPSFHSLCTRCRHSWSGGHGGGATTSVNNAPSACHACGHSTSPRTRAADSPSSSCAHTPAPSMRRSPPPPNSRSSPRVSGLFSSIVHSRPPITRAHTDVPVHPYNFPLQGSATCTHCSPPSLGVAHDTHVSSSLPATPQSAVPHPHFRATRPTSMSRLYPSSVPRPRASFPRTRTQTHAHQPLLVARHPTQLLNKRSTLSHVDVPPLIHEFSGYESHDTTTDHEHGEEERLARVSSASDLHKGDSQSNSIKLRNSVHETEENRRFSKNTAVSHITSVSTTARSIDIDRHRSSPPSKRSTDRSSTSSPSDSPSPTSSPAELVGGSGKVGDGNSLEDALSPLSTIDTNANFSRATVSSGPASCASSSQISRSELQRENNFGQQSRGRTRETFPRTASTTAKKKASKSSRRRQRRRVRRASMPVVDRSSDDDDFDFEGTGAPLTPPEERLPSVQEEPPGESTCVWLLLLLVFGFVLRV